MENKDNTELLTDKVNQSASVNKDNEELIFSGEITFHKDKNGRYQTTPKVYYKHPLMPTIPGTEQNS